MRMFRCLLASCAVFVSVVPGFAQTNKPVATSTNMAAMTNKWVSSISLGLTITRGNSDTLLASATAATERKWPNNDLSLGGDALYGESKIAGSGTQETAERVHGFAQENRMFTTNWYAYARIEALHDGIADIDYRLTVAPGVGYYFIKIPKMDFSAEAGPGYIIEKLDDAPTDQYATLRFGEKFHYNISAHAKWWETAEILPQVNDFDNYIINAELGIEAGLTKKNNLALRTVLDDNYNNVPALARVPNDLKLITALVYKF